MNRFAIAIHGGAGNILKSELAPDQEQAYLHALTEALKAGKKILKSGGTALDAVNAAVISLEDCPLFNAGRGSVFTAEGAHEMEASMMCGKTLNAGAVAGIKNIKNPIELAYKVFYDKDFVFLSGEGAIAYAKEHGLEFVPDNYFYSEYRYQQLKKAKSSSQIVLDHTGDRNFGTVGAVAMDMQGNLAAATSTGGLTNKKWGRLGDSSVIGSGTYANNATCAVSCTGYGEFFLRAVVAHDISCLMEYKGLSMKEASAKVVKDKLKKMGGEGGIIAVDSQGRVELCFNSEGMYRGWASSENETGEVAIYG